MKTLSTRIGFRLPAWLVCAAVLALGVASAASASAPFNTQMPTFTQSGNTLTLNNGGWMNYADPVDRYVFRFTRNGVVVKGPADVPMTSPPDQHLVGEYPHDPQANVYQLGAADNGTTFCGDVWGGTHSVHYYGNGNLAYDLIEWGHTDQYGNAAHVCVVISGATGGSGGGGGGGPGLPPLVLDPAALPSATAGFAYPTQTLRTAGGTGPYAYSLTGGALPGGMTLSPTGLVAGTPTRAGSSTFTVQTKDATGRTATRSYTISVAWPKLTVSPAELPAIVSDSPFDLELSATGGVAPYTFTISEGSPPRGLTLTADGVLSGTPSAQAGIYRFTVAVLDANGAPASIVYSLTLAAPTLEFLTEPRVAHVRKRYRFQLAVAGGAAPYRFAKVDGTMPRGLVLSPAGVVSGIPKRIGASRVRIRVIDANNAWSDHVYRFVVRR